MNLTRFLRDKVLAMLFFFSSTRTRASFEAGMAQLGGHAMFLDSTSTQIGHGDTWKEIGEILGRYNDGIAIRQVDWGIGNDYIRAVAEASRTPVLNMQCDWYHPFQALADLQTVIEHKGDPKGLTINVSYAYRRELPEADQRSPERDPAHDPLWRERAADPPSRVQAHARGRGPGRGERQEGPRELRDHRGLRRGDERRRRRLRQELGLHAHHRRPRRGQRRSPRSTTDWIADERRMEMADEDAIYMHPLPADRNIEVTDGVIDGRWSAVFDQAENRLHAQKAVMALTM